MTRLGRRRAAALTLIELLVVMVILDILAGSITFYVANKADQARVSRAKADIATLSTALEAYNVAMGEFPTSEQGLQALWAPPAGVSSDKWHNGGGPFVKMQNFYDPWGREYKYVAPGADGRDYDLSSLGPEGKNAAINSWELNKPPGK